MAKKKGNNSKSNAASVESMPRGSDDAAGTQPAPATQAQPAVEQMDVEQLRAELMAARAELAKLRSQAGTTAAAGKLGKQPEEVQELHTKLQQLRKDQQEADAARDKAWMQLKAVVKEISDLASPDYLQSLVVPKPQSD